MDPESPEVDESELRVPLPARGSSARQELEENLTRLVETACDLVGATRVGVWLLERDGSALHRVHLYDGASGRHTGGGVLSRERFPDYFRSLEDEGGTLCADDALADDRTRELADPYARPLGIHGWLDTPLPGADAPMVGVLRFEVTGAARRWTAAERETAASFGEVVSRVLHRYGDRSVSGSLSTGADAGDAGDVLESGRTLRRLPVGLLLTDTAGEILGCNESLAEMLGYEEPGELVGRNVRSVYASENGRNGLVRYLRNRQGEIRRHQAEAVRRDGSQIWILENAVLLPADERDRILSAVLDATEIKAREEKLEEQAHRDPLTGLANRRLFHETAAQTLALADRYGRRAAVAYLDLSGFKAVNDRYGHDVGDRVLQATGSRLREGVRDSDLVARLGGDEFAILFAEVEGRNGAREVANRLLDSLQRPIQVNGHEFRLRAQLGVSLYPDHGHDAEALLRRADRAMYAAKQIDRDLVLADDEEEPLPEEPQPLHPGLDGGAVTELEGPERRERGSGREGRGDEIEVHPVPPEESGQPEPSPEPPVGEMEAEEKKEAVAPRGGRDETAEPTAEGGIRSGITEETLRRAIEEDELELHYQPIYRVPDLTLTGAEALLRWNHPEVGRLDAEEFVPRAEELDLVQALDRWAVSTAVRQLERWPAGREGVPEWIAVNVSDRSLAGLAFYLEAILSRREMDPSRLIVEVVMPDGLPSVDRTTRVLRYLRDRGCRVALDCDTELGHLVELLERGAVDMIKMDRTYLERNRTGAAAVPGRLSDVSGFFDVDVLVKRVETARQFRAARDESVSMIQGFYHGQPVPAEELRAC